MEKASNLNQDEFLTLLMMYAGNIDGKITKEEDEMIRQKAGEDTFTKIRAIFEGLNDSETLDLILSYKGQFCKTKEEADNALTLVREVFDADHRFSQIEQAVLKLFQLLMAK
jgi:hypothetical protein